MYLYLLVSGIIIKISANSVKIARDEQVDSILSFTGHAFKIPEDAVPFITFSDQYLQRLDGKGLKEMP